jgi:hypothetical protein
LADQ